MAYLLLVTIVTFLPLKAFILSWGRFALDGGDGCTWGRALVISDDRSCLIVLRLDAT